jgi:type I restriction enzyme S subunit
MIKTTKTISEVCHINPKLNSVISGNTDVSFVPMSAVSEEGNIDVSQTRKFNEVKKGYTYFGNGDVLFAKITPCMENGKGAIAENLVNGIGYGSTEFHVIRPNKNEITSKWIHYIVHSKQFRTIAAQNMTGTAGQKRVPVSFLESRKIPVPPLTVQENIASILEKAESAIEKRKEANRLTDEFLESAFIEMFGDPLRNPKGWQVAEVQDVAASEKHSIKAGPFGSSLKKEVYVKKGYKIYGQEQVIRDDLTYGDYYMFGKQ